MFGVGLRAACFHSDMTKHTVSPSSSSLLSPPTNCLPHSSPRLSICPCLSVCEHRAKTLRPRKPPPTFTTCLLPSPCPRPPPHPTSPLLKKKKYNLSVSSEKEISLQFHDLNQWKYGIRRCTLTCETAAKRKGNEINGEGSLFFQLGLEFVFVWSFVRKWK